MVEGGSEEVQGQFGIDRTLSKQRGKKEKWGLMECGRRRETGRSGEWEAERTGQIG